jgi:hypothetical protein
MTNDKGIAFLEAALVAASFVAYDRGDASDD